MTKRGKKKERKRNQRQCGCLGAAAPSCHLAVLGMHGLVPCRAWPLSPLTCHQRPVQVVRTQISRGDMWPEAEVPCPCGRVPPPGLPGLPRVPPPGTSPLRCLCMSLRWPFSSHGPGSGAEARPLSSLTTPQEPVAFCFFVCFSTFSTKLANSFCLLGYWLLELNRFLVKLVSGSW